MSKEKDWHLEYLRAQDDIEALQRKIQKIQKQGDEGKDARALEAMEKMAVSLESIAKSVELILEIAKRRVT